ncbi:hypothetical protein MC885_018350 [Smutsia gigantea]|nr:hypothetical protein MC885_018350 [Smutsia gigantea]
MNRRRNRTKFTEDQLKILVSAFNQKPYPGYATKRKLALEFNTEESRIQNRRARYRPQKGSEPEKGLEPSQDQDSAEEEIQSKQCAPVWFQNRRSRFHVQRKREADEVLERSQDRGQESLADGRAPETTQNGLNVPGDCPVSLESEQGLEKDIQCV